jgi:hypothetical protein
LGHLSDIKANAIAVKIGIAAARISRIYCGMNKISKYISPICTIAMAAITSLSSPVLAEITASSDTGFVILHSAEVSATPGQIWNRLIAPNKWWNKKHTWSASADGMTIDAKAGGCFCEVLPGQKTGGKIGAAGSVEHMRVIFVQPDRVLRMQGALGPMQSEAVLGTLTVAIVPGDTAGKTKLSFSYVIGGYMRYKVSELAPNVDKVIGEQFAGLIEPFKLTAKEDAGADNWFIDLKDVKPEDPATGESGDALDPVSIPKKTAPSKPSIGTKAPVTKKAPVIKKPSAPVKPKPSTTEKSR